MSENDETCQRDIGDAWQRYRCTRPVKRDGMCAVHAAAADRSKRAAERRAQEVEAKKDAYRRRVVIAAALTERIAESKGHRGEIMILY